MYDEEETTKDDFFPSEETLDDDFFDPLDDDRLDDDLEVIPKEDEDDEDFIDSIEKYG